MSIVIVPSSLNGPASRSAFQTATNGMPNVLIVANFQEFLDHVETNPAPKAIVMDFGWLQSAEEDFPYKNAALREVPHIIIDHRADMRDPKYYEDACEELGIKFSASVTGKSIDTNGFRATVSKAAGMAPV